MLAGAEGIEPATAVLETDVIPLHHAPVRKSRKPAKDSTAANSRKAEFTHFLKELGDTECIEPPLQLTLNHVNISLKVDPKLKHSPFILGLFLLHSLPPQGYKHNT